MEKSKHIAGQILTLLMVLAIASPLAMSAGTGTQSDTNERPPDFPVTSQNPSEIGPIILKIDEAIISKHIQVLENLKTRYAYRGDKCKLAGDYIYSVFQQNGLQAEFDPFVYNNYDMWNIVGTKTGTSNPDAHLLITAHYDSITSSRAWTIAPGADDNASGVAAVLAAAEILSDYDFNCTIKFIAFGGEELGLEGAEHYASEAVANGDNITGVINLDMIASNDAELTEVNMHYPSIGEVPTGLMSHMHSVAENYSHIFPITIRDAGISGSSDHQPFGPYYEAIFLIERDFSSYYHSVNDLLDKLNMTYAANVTQLAVAGLMELAGLNSTDNAPPAHSPGFPPNNGYGQAQPPISIELTDPSDIDLAGLKMWVDGTQVAPNAAPISLGNNISYVPPVPFVDGQLVNVSIAANDTQGNGFTHSWEFTVDAFAPAPPMNFTIELSSIQMDKQGMVMNVGPDPYDSKHALAPSVLYRDGEYKMWYGAHNNSRYHICYANSSDGLSWTKQGMVLYGTPGGHDSSWALYPEVIYDGEYKMWYSGYDGSHWRIMFATSPDGISWAKQGTVIDAGSLGDLNNMHVFHPAVVKGSEFEMWYTAVGQGAYRIIYANSTDGISWNQLPQNVAPLGAGALLEDSLVAYPEVIFDGTQYHMWYNRHDGVFQRTAYANSEDGITWCDHGLSINSGQTVGDYDYFRATHCSAMIEGDEVRVWYSGYNNANWRIMYANLSLQSIKSDITLSWDPSTSGDVIRYEIYRESRPTAFSTLKKAYPEYYMAFDTQTLWTMEAASVANISVFGPYGGSEPTYFYLPDDNIESISLFIQKPGGAWIALQEDVEFGMDYISGIAEIVSDDLVPGSVVYATYQHRANRALVTTGTSISDIGAGIGSPDNYFYIIQAVDRAGHVTRQPTILGKQVNVLDAGWNLICDPFIQSPALVSEALATLGWEMARTYDPGLENPWTSNVPGRAESLNTLTFVNATDGIWVKLASPGTHIALGPVQNLTYNLKVGWNLVSYPHFEMASVGEILFGVPWDLAAVFWPGAPYLVMDVPDMDLIQAQGFWVRVTSDAVWNAYNY